MSAMQGESAWLEEIVEEGLVVHWLDLVAWSGQAAIVAFVATLLATPIMRVVAIRSGVVDRPNASRKIHREAIPYFGGVAVLIGLLVAIAYMAVVKSAYIPEEYDRVPIAVIAGMLAVALTGLADDIWQVDPRLKIAGQLVAAALLATNDIGVELVQGVINPLLDLQHADQGPWAHVSYWASTAILAALVLGACNAANLIDGLDGLLAGTTAISALGLVAIGVLVAVHLGLTQGTAPEIGAIAAGGPPDALDPTSARVTLAFALLGAALGFLPYNFNPARIFLGDCGSLLMGFVTIVVIIMFGHFGQTHLVFAGLIVFGLPILDTALAIVRRKMTGQSISAADDNHIHHLFLRSLGSVRKAVLALYAMAAFFAASGVTLAYLSLFTDWRVRELYGMVLLVMVGLGVILLGAGRRSQAQRASAEASDSIAIESGGQQADATAGTTAGTTVGTTEETKRSA